MSNEAFFAALLFYKQDPPKERMDRYFTGSDFGKNAAGKAGIHGVVDGEGIDRHILV